MTDASGTDDLWEVELDHIPDVAMAEEIEEERFVCPAAGWMDAFEETWLGRVAAPFAVRARRSGWRAEEAGAYCPTCGTTTGPGVIDHAGRCPECRSRRMAWSRAVRLGSYRGELAHAIRQVKFTRFRALGVELGRMLGAAVGEALDAAGVPRQEAVLVPVPMHWSRRWTRGVDHTLTIARGMRRATGLRVWRPLRRCAGPVLLGLGPAARSRAVAQAFTSRGTWPDGVRVAIVVDDVRTTGATLRAAVRAMPPMPAGGAIWVATVAVTPARTEPGASGGS